MSLAKAFQVGVWLPELENCRAEQDFPGDDRLSALEDSGKPEIKPVPSEDEKIATISK